MVCLCSICSTGKEFSVKRSLSVSSHHHHPSCPCMPMSCDVSEDCSCIMHWTLCVQACMQKKTAELQKVIDWFAAEMQPFAACKPSASFPEHFLEHSDRVTESTSKKVTLAMKHPCHFQIWTPCLMLTVTETTQQI